MDKTDRLDPLIERRDRTWENDILSIREKPAMVLEWQFHAAAELDRFCHDTVGRHVDQGAFASTGNTVWLRFSPWAMYMVSQKPVQLDFNPESPGTGTDISHGKCLLTLQGASVLPFVGDYCSVDIFSDPTTRNKMAKTRFMEYEIVLWWTTETRLDLLVDRSYAQSFLEFVQSLLIRRYHKDR